LAKTAQKTPLPAVHLLMCAYLLLWKCLPCHCLAMAASICSTIMAFSQYLFKSITLPYTAYFFTTVHNYYTEQLGKTRVLPSDNVKKETTFPFMTCRIINCQHVLEYA
jgi:hypothetical protein